MEEKKTSTFQVAVARDEIAKIEKESVPDYNKNADGLYNVYKCLKLIGSWINCIRKAINEYENNDYSLKGQNGRMNLRKKTKRANYLTGMGMKIFLVNFRFIKLILFKEFVILRNLVRHLNFVF